MATSQRTSSPASPHPTPAHEWVPTQDWVPPEAADPTASYPRVLHCARCVAHALQPAPGAPLDVHQPECVSTEPDPDEEGGEDGFFLTRWDARLLLALLTGLHAQPGFAHLSADGSRAFVRAERLGDRLRDYLTQFSSSA